MDPFKLAELRHRFGNDLNQWGGYLKAHCETSILLARLDETVQASRQNYGTQLLPNLHALAVHLWETLLLPSPLCQAQVNHPSIQAFFDMLEKYIALQEPFPDLDLDIRFMTQMLAGDISENPDRGLELERNTVKLMTLQKLCELRLESDYQLWFDLRSSNWLRSDHHAVINPHLISQAWPIDQPWTLDRDEELMIDKLARAVRKGLRYGRKRPWFFACEYDVSGKPQRFDRLVKALSGAFQSGNEVTLQL